MDPTDTDEPSRKLQALRDYKRTLDQQEAGIYGAMHGAEALPHIWAERAKVEEEIASLQRSMEAIWFEVSRTPLAGGTITCPHGHSDASYTGNVIRVEASDPAGVRSGFAWTYICQACSRQYLVRGAIIQGQIEMLDASPEMRE